MKKPKKVIECYNNSEMYQCQRCKDDTDSEGWYCNTCNPPQNVDFDIYEDIGGSKINLKDHKVCPYCYNQLINKAFPPTTEGKPS